jgi:hypothetical protein|tara:strand:+ start:726 stop:1190 length:465 start_codon:yes stop_codon:yes gene_type:complete
MSDDKRISRSSQERKVTERPKPWAPPSSLDAPTPPEGFVHRWLRAEIAGFEDTANISKRQREGYELVRGDELKPGDKHYPVYSEQSKYKGYIGVGGLVLARIPIEIARSRAEYYKKLTQDQLTAVDNDLMKEQNPAMPINISRQSKVSFGGGNK